ncbi:MAG: hypothetical protein WDM91_11175 [Rhizomicrobium sp.]
MTRLWLKDAIAGAMLAVFLTGCACLPLIAPYGIADLTNHPGLSGHHHQRSIEP